MKKKWIALGTTLVMIAAMSMPVVAADFFREVKAKLRPDITVMLDGKSQSFRTSDGEEIVPIMYNGSVYLPLRATAQLVDYDVDWNGKTKTVTLSANQNAKKDAAAQTAAAITAEEAKAIALKHAGLSSATWVKVEKDRDDGVTKYEIEFRDGRMEYEYDIHAETGKILKAEKDYDD